jgi:hypothetical protein
MAEKRNAQEVLVEKTFGIKNDKNNMDLKHETY